MRHKPRNKAHKWNKRKDAKACVECGVAFKKGDMVYDSVAINIHVECLAAYDKTMRELYAKPAAPGVPR